MEISSETRQFIAAHAHDDVRKLALSHGGRTDIDLPFALNQISGRQMAQRKLPQWAALDGIIYPPHLSMEQCSSEQTAIEKCRMVEQWMTKRAIMADFTGGFGVDFSYLARLFDEAHYVERQEHLCAIAEENFRVLGLPHARVHCGEGEQWMENCPNLSLIYIDPARRDDAGSRTYAIADCTPNIIPLLPSMLSKAHKVLVKLSPMLDIAGAVHELNNAVGHNIVAEVRVVSVGNECKELLFMLAKDAPVPVLTCINDEQRFACALEGSTTARYPIASEAPSMGQCLLVPNASLMKAGCFGPLCTSFDVAALSPVSHLFVAPAPLSDFPGRQFIVEGVSTMGKKELRSFLQGIETANVAVRNFPLSAADLKKRLKLKDGGEWFIFGTTVGARRHVLIKCRKTEAHL